MTAKETAILKTFVKVLPLIDDHEKDKLLYFGCGMAFIAKKNQQNAS